MIRPARPEEAEAVARVHIESWQAAYTHIFSREQLMGLSTEGRREMFRRSPPLVAEVDGRIVGFVAVGTSRDPDADGELYAIYVHPDHWGAGVGRALIEAGERRLGELGHARAILWVLEDNPRARRFYEVAGWSTDGSQRPIEVFGALVPEVRYEKDLQTA